MEYGSTHEVCVGFYFYYMLFHFIIEILFLYFNNFCVLELLQGTNNVIKYHTAGVKATMPMNNSDKTLCVQSNLK